MSGCTLQFTRNSPLRTTLVDEATGHAVYEIDTPVRLAGSATRIRRFDPQTQQAYRWGNDEDSDSDDDSIRKDKKERHDTKKYANDGEELETVEDLPETSDEIARIYWKWFSTDDVIFRGRKTTREVLLPKCGKMKGSYLFTGPDGNQYRWAMGAFGMNYPKLVTVDEKKTVVAEFHRAHHFTKKQKARLEVQPAGMEMLDYIILTFVFAEEKRRARETRARTSHGGGGG